MPPIRAAQEYPSLTAGDPLWRLASELDFPISAHGEYRQRRFQPFRQLEGERRDNTELALRGLDHALGFFATT